MILYLHGFLSTGESYKAQWFKQAFGELGIEVLTPTYPLAMPEASIAYLKNYIEEHILPKSPQKTTDEYPPAWQIFGSSMGGFFGEYLSETYGVPLVMINPALDPVPVFENYLGVHTHPKTGEELIIDGVFIESLKKHTTPKPVTAPSLLLLDKQDETIPYEFAFRKYQNVPQSKALAYEGGDHAFQHLNEAWEEVKQFVEANGV